MVPLVRTAVRKLTQHLELREREWWIANCCFARNHNTPGSCRSTSNLERYYVNRNRCFSRCRNLPMDRTIISRTSARTLAALCSGRAFGCHPNPEFPATVHRARTRIAGSLMQLMANNRKHPCTHRKHVLNIWFYLKIRTAMASKKKKFFFVSLMIQRTVPRVEAEPRRLKITFSRKIFCDAVAKQKLL